MTTIALKQDWQDGRRLKLLLDDFNARTSVSPEGSVGFEDFDFQQTFSLLDGAFRCPAALTPHELSSIVHRAMVDLRKAGLVSSEPLLKTLNRLASEALSRPNSRFTMWTALRLRNLNQSGGFRLRYKNVLLQARHQLPAGLKLKSYLLPGVKRIDPNSSSNFSYLICRTEARNEEGAARQIFEATDLFMAITNVAWRQWNIFGGEHHAEAKLWEGPYQFFWQGRKFLGSERIWFNAEFDLEEWDRHPKTGSEFKRLLPVVRRGLAKLERHPLSTIISQALRLLHDGMASRDLSYRLLRFWSALETLFARETESRSDTIIRRAIFAEEDPAIPKLKLQYLSEIRNKYVHAGLENDNVYHLVQFLRDLVSTHVMYLLYHGDDFASHDEYIAMSNLPSGLDALESHRRAVERRENIIKIRRHKPVSV